MDDVEIVIEKDVVVISWNDEDIQQMSEELGEPEFPESRPCG